MEEPAGTWNATIAWCDGTATTLKGNGRALDAAAAAHREITDPAKRRDRRPVLCVSAAETVSGKTAGPEIIRYTADGRVCTIEEGDLDEDRRLASVHVVIGATEPSGETLDGLDDTACRSFAQGARRQVFIANQVRPHDDEPRYYFVRRLQVPQTEAENGEPGSRPPGARDRTR